MKIKNLLPLPLLFALVAPAGRGQAVPAQPPKRDEKPEISQFVLYAERSIKLGERSHAERGDVGVRTPLVLREGVQLSVGKHDRCRNLFAPSILIERDAEVHNVATNSLKKEPDVEMGAESTFPADMPPLPLAAASGSGADVRVERHHRRSLTPGTYGEVRLGPHGELRLAAGKYTFASVKMDEHSKLLPGRGERAGEYARADRGGVAVLIVGGLWMGEDARITRWQRISPSESRGPTRACLATTTGLGPGMSSPSAGKPGSTRCSRRRTEPFGWPTMPGSKARLRASTSWRRRKFTQSSRTAFRCPLRTGMVHSSSTATSDHHRIRPSPRSRVPSRHPRW